MVKSEYEDRWGFEQWAKTYDEDIAEAAQSDDWMFQDYNCILNRVVESCELSYNTYSTVLDIGVGTGNLASRFLETGIQVIGIDPSKEMRRICQQKYHLVEVRDGNFLNIPLPDKSVDVIVSTYAFHHVMPEQKEASIREMKRVLKPRGRIVIADLMFQNRSEERRIKMELRQSGNSGTADELDDEYPALVDSLGQSFHKAGLIFHSEQLTSSTWVITACSLS